MSVFERGRERGREREREREMDPNEAYMLEEAKQFPTEQSEDLFPSLWNSFDWLDLDQNPSSYHHYNTHPSFPPPIIPQHHFTQFHNQSPPFVASPEPTTFEPHRDFHQPLNDYVGSEFKTEPVRSSEGVLPVRLGVGTDGKAMEGRSSKNLMAERRRRKRLNDRLSMLRSIVPNISKMDKTATLGDTIDYINDLLGRIKTLQQDVEAHPHSASLTHSFNPPNGILKGSSYPKIEVEKRESDMWIEMYCEGSSNRLIATIAAMESLGLEIEQCAISCFNGFEVHASCSKGSEQHDSEEIKQLLLVNSGYDGITK
ncbi:PREDICTED: transcription factor bHLH93-like isoform X1 [Tarenaya hassleriana]|uniref:transcription factor bHLH93-like isoform X2 n=1 Tax=Tarenaya hassleriana TaxID=28532 RepID=UPI00053C1E42|nr:PREDICTED: transcription factor bHLH93-like isoform X2 [Tarenaya hassleriana]XP_019056474.1 PREDICTED: transcription factor bHLH93-like isoform X1 [Tarenaya hassleriana]